MLVRIIALLLADLLQQLVVCNNLCHFCQGGHCTEVPNCAITVKACALMLVHMSEKSFSSEKLVLCAALPAAPLH
jgi:hypothetical protein